MAKHKNKRPESRKARGRRSEPMIPQEFEGMARMTRDGFMFVTVEGLPEDIYVRVGKTRGALNGDRVKVAILKPHARTRRLEGVVTKIVERSQKPFVGILHIVGRQAWVLMSSKFMPYDITVPIPEDTNAVSGMKVAAVIDGWPPHEPNPRGHIVDILGKPGENDTEMHAILSEYGLPYRFNKEVVAEAEAIPDAITDRDRKGRKDFRGTLTFTIDPIDAKDYDDALSLRTLEDGNLEVGIHIADVTYYVKPGTLLDKEAQARGTSVYLVDRTVPMLPEKLSNKLCSLRPGEEKLTFSAVFKMSPNGKVIESWFGRTMIVSDYRFDYDLAQEIIEAGEDAMQRQFGEGSESGIVPDDIKRAVLTLNSLALKLRKKRFAAGAINFERPEMKVLVDEKGKPVDVKQKISKEANWLIEEFMLLANREVAHFAGSRTFVYRIHDEPNGEKIAGLRGFASNFGYKMGPTGNGGEISKSLAELFAKAKDKPEFAALELVALRAMAKACYSTDNIGHYGLAFKYYTHFTSPIRRYPDMMVHRLLAEYLDKGKSADKGYYEQQCKHASEREVIAADAERDSIKYKLVEYMQERIGNEYDGHISGLTEWGMYVEIEPTKVEGMVPLRDIRTDFFDFDEERYRIVGRRTHKIYRLGDPVRIRVKDTSLDQKLIDYELL